MKNEHASRVFLVLGSIAVFAISVAAGYMIVQSPAPSATEVPSAPPPEEVAGPPATPSPVLPPSSPTPTPAAPPVPDTAQVQRLSREIPSSAAPETPGSTHGTDAGRPAPSIPKGSPLFRIQVGAFVRLDNAEDRVRRLRSRGYTVTLVDGEPYRVLVGGYLDRAAAERLVAHVRADGFDAALDLVTPSQQTAPAESPSLPAEPVTPPGTTH